MRSRTNRERAAEAGDRAGVEGRRVKGRALLTALAAALVLSGVVVGWACRASAGGGAASPQTMAAVPPKEISVAASAQAQADPVVTTLTPSGFTPDGVSHTAGRFNLKVRNQSGQREVALRLSNSAGEKLWEVRLTDKARDWTGPLELAAGTYTLSEASHPDWTCRIEVTQQ